MTGRIEFVEDEPVFEPEPPHPPRDRRYWIVRATAVAGVAVALTTWIATRPPSNPAHAAHHRALQPVPSILDTEPIQGHTQCRDGGPVDIDVAAAMHRFLHRVTLQPVLGTRCVLMIGAKRRVVTEGITASAHGYDVQVILSARSAEFPLPVARDRSIELGRIETEAAGVRVQVIATGFPASNPPMVRLQRLADYLSLNTAL